MYIPAALLAKSLSQTRGNDSGGLGMELADFMAPMVVLSVSKIGIATFGLTPRGVGRTGISRSRPAIKTIDKVILGGRKIRTAT